MLETHQIVIVGAGGIGRAAGLILAESNELNTQIFIGDLFPETAREAVQWIDEGCGRKGSAISFIMPEEGANEDMIRIFKKCAVVLDCLPGSQAPRIARLAREYGLHYANLTEYVKETNEVIEIAKGSEQGFVLQTGLAPGFINILANKLYIDFCKKHQVEKVDAINMKVGALSRHATAPHFYGFTWSPVGVATEYLKDSVVVRDGKKQHLPALSECAKIIIDGITYEDNLTSGGAADLPDYFEGKVDVLDYKTIRYPGHYQWVVETIAGLPDDEKRVDALRNTMLNKIPAVEDDLVIIYAAVSGRDQRGVLRAMEAAYRIEPIVIGNKKLRAIQATTAAPLCEVAHMLLKGSWKGPVFQSKINPSHFLNGPFVSRVYGAKNGSDVNEAEPKLALR